MLTNLFAIMTTIFHIILDEKFIDCAIEQFNNISFVTNRYVFYQPQKTYKLKYIKNESIIEFFPTWHDLKQLLYKSKYDILILHSLILKSSILLRIPRTVKIVWLSWGWDIYVDQSFRHLSDLPIRLPLYKPVTRNFINHNFKILIRRLAIGCYFFYRRKILYKRMIGRIDYCSTVLPNERNYLVKCNYFKAKTFLFRYGSEKSEIKDPYSLSDKFIGNNILVGNSAAFENNQLDIIAILNTIPILDRKIILPLSYGGDKLYVRKIISEVRKSNKECVPLLEFMPSKEYCDIIKSCSHVIMGHIRQQGMGNIIQSILRGCKLFLYKDSIAYSYLKSCGYYVYTIEEDLNEIELTETLSDEEIIHNRCLASEHTSLKNMRIKLEESIRKVISEI